MPISQMGEQAGRGYPTVPQPQGGREESLQESPGSAPS